MRLVAGAAPLVLVNRGFGYQGFLLLVAIAATSERCTYVVLIMARCTQVMWSGLLIAYGCGLFGVTSDTSLDRQLALVRLVALNAVGVAMVLLSRVAINAIARSFCLRMALMASQAVRVSCVGPSRDCFLFLLVAIGTIGASYPENVRLVAARAILVVTRQYIGAGYGHLSLVALRA